LRQDPNFFPKNHFGDGSFVVWGAFCSPGALSLAFPSCRMVSQECIRVLECNLFPFLEENEEIHFIFQRNIAAVHNSKATIDFLNQNSITVLQWPASFLDQNLTENLWGIIVKIVCAEKRQYQWINVLQIAIIMASEGIKVDTPKQLVCSMPDRLFELIKSN